jgi:hypothetical protein
MVHVHACRFRLIPAPGTGRRGGNLFSTVDSYFLGKIFLANRRAFGVVNILTGLVNVLDPSRSG